jgi:hypothetical protein
MGHLASRPEGNESGVLQGSFSISAEELEKMVEELKESDMVTRAHSPKFRPLSLEKSRTVFFAPLLDPLLDSFGPSLGPYGPSLAPFGPLLGPYGPSSGPFCPSLAGSFLFFVNTFRSFIGSFWSFFEYVSFARSLWSYETDCT